MPVTSDFKLTHSFPAKLCAGEAVSRTWAKLDPNTQAALDKTNEFVVEQMRIYDAKMQKLK
jgi:hypothetical protein